MKKKVFFAKKNVTRPIICCCTACKYQVLRIRREFCAPSCTTGRLGTFLYELPYFPVQCQLVQPPFASECLCKTVLLFEANAESARQFASHKGSVFQQPTSAALPVNCARILNVLLASAHFPVTQADSFEPHRLFTPLDVSRWIARLACSVLSSQV